MKQLNTTVDVIDQLGGDKSVADLLGTTAKAVGNWRYSGLFPAHTYIELRKALKKKRCTAPDELWNMTLGSSQ